MMNGLIEAISGFTRLALIGIGSDIRGDDGIGIYITERLKKHNRKSNIDIYFGGTTPENLTGKLKRSVPSHVIMIDAYRSDDAGVPVALIDPLTADGLDFSTHAFSLGTLAAYITAETGAKVMILGIRAGDLRFGEKMSREVTDSGKKIVEFFRKKIF